MFKIYSKNNLRICMSLYDVTEIYLNVQKIASALNVHISI